MLASRLNHRAHLLCGSLDEKATSLGVGRTLTDEGTMLWDFGVDHPGGAEAGLLLARVCLADLADVSLEDAKPWPLVRVATEAPTAACMASQYAGWEVQGEGFFAMGSGPMRAAAGREPLFDHIGCREQAEHCVGVLESSRLPGGDVCHTIAEKCGVAPDRLTLLVAPTNSPAGTLQVVARSVETALHKLHELGFDLTRVHSATGTAPLPPVAADALAAIGVTNDAVLYGGRVTLEVTGDDQSLREIAPRVPSSSSPDYGRPFGETLKAAGGDFYKIDPLLFSPAEVTFLNNDTGGSFRCGGVNEAVLQQSFAAAARAEP